nr:hypothetical protein [Tanacetum cinerariifolium]
QGRWFCVGVSSGGRGGDVGRVEKEQGRKESAVAGWAEKTDTVTVGLNVGEMMEYCFGFYIVSPYGYLKTYTKCSIKLCLCLVRHQNDSIVPGQGCWFCVGVSSGGRGGDVGRVEKEQGRRESAVAGWAEKTGTVTVGLNVGEMMEYCFGFYIDT